MIELLRTILIMSLSGSIVAVMLLVLKPLVRNRLPKSVQYYLWLVVIAAMLVPVSYFVKLPAATNNAPSVVMPSNVVQRYVITPEEELDRIAAINTGGRELKSPYNAQAFEQARSPISTAVIVFMLVYPFGALIVLLYYIISFSVFTRLHRRRNTTATTEEYAILAELCGKYRIAALYRNPLAATPMLIGVFRPAIILPDKKYSDAQLRAVLLHELTHLRRKDVLVKWLSVIVTAVHWFNPIVWLVRREIDRACELSCDEAVVRNLDIDGKQNYGETLIYVAADSKTPYAVLPTTMCEEKKALRERLGAIMKSKKHTRLAVIVSTVLIFAIGGTAIALGAGRTVNYKDNQLIDVNESTAQIAESLRKFALLRTPYVGDNSAVGSIINILPPPCEQFTQKFFSIGDDYGTGKSPNTLTLYYEQNGETGDDFTITSQIPLILFAMIDNLEEVNIATRNSPSGSGLDKSAYGIRYTYPRPEATDYIPDVGITWGDFLNDWENSFVKLYTQALMNNMHEWDNAGNLTLDDVRALAAKGDALQYSDLPFLRPSMLSSIMGGYNPTLYGVEGGYRLLISFNDMMNPESGIKSTSLERIWDNSGSGIDIRYNDVDEFIKANPSHPVDSAELQPTTPPIHSPFMSSWKPLHELPADYSTEQAVADSVYVNIHGSQIYNQVMVDQFYADVYSGGAAFLRVMRYTIEGDAILVDYQYDGEMFTVTHDSTRDRFGAGEITTYNYKYLVADDRSVPAGQPLSYYLSNRKNIFAGAGNTLIEGIWQLPSPSTQKERAPQLEAVLTTNGFPEQRIEAAQLTTSWSYIDENGNSVGYEADSPHALQLDNYDDISLRLNGSNGEISFNFGGGYKPQSVSVQRWDAVYYMGRQYIESSINKNEPITIDGNTLRISNDGNDYIYEVYAVYEQGSSYYAFRVNASN